MANIRPIKDKNGIISSYQIRVYRGRDASGKQLKPYQTTWRVPDNMKNPRSIEKEVSKFAAIFESECKAGLVASDKKTFAEYAEYVISLKERDNKHRTVVRYKELLERINPEIGYIKLGEVTGEHLNRLYLKLSKPGQNKHTGEGLSAKTILEHHRLIHTIYAQAKKEGAVRFNVAETATPPVVKKKEAEYFELDEVHRIMDCLKKEPVKWQCITLLLIASGARRGEIMALKWSAVNFQKNTVEISANLLYSSDKGVYVDTPKTGELRYVSIAPEVMQRLALHKREQTIQRFQMGLEWENTGFCFTQANGKPMHPNSITDWLSKFSKKYDLPHIYPHKFRHTQASLLYALGVDPITISKRLGHKQVSTTQNIYAHMVAKADCEANEAVATVLFNAESNKKSS